MLRRFVLELAGRPFAEGVEWEREWYSWVNYQDSEWPTVGKHGPNKAHGRRKFLRGFVPEVVVRFIDPPRPAELDETLAHRFKEPLSQGEQ